MNTIKCFYTKLIMFVKSLLIPIIKIDRAESMYRDVRHLLNEDLGSVAYMTIFKHIFVRGVFIVRCYIHFTFFQGNYNLNFARKSPLRTLQG